MPCVRFCRASPIEPIAHRRPGKPKTLVNRPVETCAKPSTGKNHPAVQQEGITG